MCAVIGPLWHDQGVFPTSPQNDGDRTGRPERSGRSYGPRDPRRTGRPGGYAEREPTQGWGPPGEPPGRDRTRAERPPRRGVTAPEHPEEFRRPDQPPGEAVPVRRLLSLGVAGFAGLLGAALIFGAQSAGVGAARIPYAVVIFGIQALFVLAWTVAVRPPAPRVVGTVGIATAIAADFAAVWPIQATAAPIGYVAAAGFVAGVVGQLVRRSGRVRATESLGATLVVVVGVVSFALLIVLTRLYLGTQAIVVSMSAVGVSLVVARVADAIAPYPRLAPQVPRGAGGIVIGAMCGTFLGAILGSFFVEFDPQRGALVGLVAAIAAVLADLAVGYAEASRRLAGEPGSLWLARHLQGPLGGYALAAPTVYVISVIFLVPNS